MHPAPSLSGVTCRPRRGCLAICARGPSRRAGRSPSRFLFPSEACRPTDINLINSFHEAIAAMSEKVLICGSVAFDTIAVFEGHFNDHILDDGIQSLIDSLFLQNLRMVYRW